MGDQFLCCGVFLFVKAMDCGGLFLLKRWSVGNQFLCCVVFLFVKAMVCGGTLFIRATICGEHLALFTKAMVCGGTIPLLCVFSIFTVCRLD